MGQEGRSTGGVRIAFATYRGLPSGSNDDRLVLEELARRGVDASPRVWDDPTIDWGEFDLVVIRSTWDYFERPEQFLRWVPSTSGITRLWNSGEVVRWNAHKGYLFDLAASGVAVVPTELVRRHEATTLREVLDRRGWEEAMVKPAIGGNAYRSRRVPSGQAEHAEAHLRELLEAGDALIQPFQDRIGDRGEQSLVFIDGEFSHAVRYASALAETTRRPDPFAPSAEELATARRTLAAVDGPTLYARLDYLPEGDEGWRLGELELIEPELFFGAHRGSVGRFADACLGRLGAPAGA